MSSHRPAPTPVPIPQAPAQSAGTSPNPCCGKNDAETPTDARAFAPLLAQYLTVLRRLTEISTLERVMLDRGIIPGPATISDPQENLAQDYALLSAAIKPKVRLLRDAGLLDVTDLERRIHHLVVLTKENRRRLKALKARCNAGVDVVMQALAEQRDGASATTDSQAASGQADPDSDSHAARLADRINAGDVTPSGTGL